MRRLIPLLLSLLLAASAPAGVAGLYRSQQMEIGAALELRADGHFRYQLDYGAVSEGAEGDWTLDGDIVRLTSKPMPTEPSFDLVRDATAPKCTLSLTVDWGKFNWSSAPNVLVAYDGAPRELHFLQADERGNVHLENCAVTTVMPLVPMFGVPGAPLKLSPATGHRLSLRFRPNDLGRAAFRGEPLKLDGSALVLERYDTQIRFLRDAP
jgi:hypothetical protein